MAKTSIEIQAEKNAQARLKEARTKQSIKEHNVRAALKNERKNRPDKTMSIPFIGDVDYKGDTEKSDSLNKELRKSKKSKKFISKTQDVLDERGATGVKRKFLWDKSPSLVASVEKRKLEKKLPSTEGSFKGGGIARRGLGRAFMKGGKV
tara:strand:- start:481 stop:930 length:450 start_codon:yes stop_codon:yes gene_type:complete